MLGILLGSERNNGEQTNLPSLVEFLGYQIQKTAGEKLKTQEAKGRMRRKATGL